MQTSVRGTPIARRTLASQLYSILEEQVLTGQLAPGSHLSEEMVGKVFGVSRSPARQAIAELERANLAVRVGARDRMIAIPTAELIEEKYEVWWIVEVGRAYLASLVATTEEIAELKTYVDRMAAAVRRKDQALYRTNCDLFHSRLRNACQNACVMRLAEECELQMRWFAALYDKNPEISLDVVREHSRILNAYRRKDLATLSTSIREHIMRQRSRILATFRQQGLPSNTSERPSVPGVRPSGATQDPGRPA